MKKGNITINELLQILENDDLCKQLLDPNDCPFLNGTKKDYLKSFDQLLDASVFKVKKTMNFKYLGIALKILNQLYLQKIKQNPFLFYEMPACTDLLELLEQYPKECKEFKTFLENINFEKSRNEIGLFYQKQVKKQKKLNEYELQDLLTYLMIYKNHRIPHEYICYIFWNLFQKDQKLKPEIYAEIFRFLILDLLQKQNKKETITIAPIDDNKPFVIKEEQFYININVIKETLEENLKPLAYLFELMEKRYKLDSLGHNKYEEIKSKKQNTIKKIIGSSFFYEEYSYLSLEQEAKQQSTIHYLRFLNEVAPDLYHQKMADYELQIKSGIENANAIEQPDPLIITLNDLLDSTVKRADEVIQNEPYLKQEYDAKGNRKKISEILELYEQEIEKKDPQNLAFYYERTILESHLSMERFIEEFISLLHYEVKLNITENLLDKIFREYFVKEINFNIRIHRLTQKELEVLLSKLNEYMLRFYEMKQKEISKYLVKDPMKWLSCNTHLNRLYGNVQHMSNPILYEKSDLSLTQVLDLNEARDIRRNVLKKKIISQRVSMVVLIILILIFSISLLILMKTVYQYWSASNSYEKIEGKWDPVSILEPDPNQNEFPMNDSIPQMDFTEVKKTNEETIAWIWIDDTPINYPVVQGADNEFYLTHLYNKKYNISGSIFGDYRNGTDFTSTNTVLYGHNLKNGSMFGSLKKYKDLNFLNNHKYVWIITPKATYQYEIYMVYEFDVSKDHYVFNFNSEKSFQSYLENIKPIVSNELEVNLDDHILTLSTCDDDKKDKRLVLLAKRLYTYLQPENVSSE